MEFKLYKCSHCGNVIWKLVDAGVPVMCCNQVMGEMVPNTTDGALEKHVPVVEKDGDQVTVKVGSVTHPMAEEHYIPIIAAVSGDTAVIRLPKPGQEPVLHTTLAGDVTAYEFCNLHGFWKGE